VGAPARAPAVRLDVTDLVTLPPSEAEAEAEGRGLTTGRRSEVSGPLQVLLDAASPASRAATSGGARAAEAPPAAESAGDDTAAWAGGVADLSFAISESVQQLSEAQIRAAHDVTARCADLEAQADLVREEGRRRREGTTPRRGAARAEADPLAAESDLWDALGQLSGRRAFREAAEALASGAVSSAAPLWRGASTTEPAGSPGSAPAERAALLRATQRAVDGTVSRHVGRVRQLVPRLLRCVQRIYAVDLQRGHEFLRSMDREAMRRLVSDAGARGDARSSSPRRLAATTVIENARKRATLGVERVLTRLRDCAEDADALRSGAESGLAQELSAAFVDFVDAMAHRVAAEGRGRAPAPVRHGSGTPVRAPEALSPAAADGADEGLGADGPSRPRSRGGSPGPHGAPALVRPRPVGGPDSSFAAVEGRPERRSPHGAAPRAVPPVEPARPAALTRPPPLAMAGHQPEDRQGPRSPPEAKELLDSPPPPTEASTTGSAARARAVSAAGSDAGAQVTPMPRASPPPSADAAPSARSPAPAGGTPLAAASHRLCEAVAAGEASDAVAELYRAAVREADGAGAAAAAGSAIRALAPSLRDVLSPFLAPGGSPVSVACLPAVGAAVDVATLLASLAAHADARASAAVLALVRPAMARLWALPSASREVAAGIVGDGSAPSAAGGGGGCLGESVLHRASAAARAAAGEDGRFLRAEAATLAASLISSPLSPPKAVEAAAAALSAVACAALTWPSADGGRQSEGDRAEAGALTHALAEACVAVRHRASDPGLTAVCADAIYRLSLDPRAQAPSGSWGVLGSLEAGLDGTGDGEGAAEVRAAVLRAAAAVAGAQWALPVLVRRAGAGARAAPGGEGEDEDDAEAAAAVVVRCESVLRELASLDTLLSAAVEAVAGSSRSMDGAAAVLALVAAVGLAPRAEGAAEPDASASLGRSVDSDVSGSSLVELLGMESCAALLGAAAEAGPDALRRSPFLLGVAGPDSGEGPDGVAALRAVFGGYARAAKAAAAALAGDGEDLGLV